MLALTEDRQKREIIATKILAERQKLQDYISYHEAQATLIDDKELSPTNTERQFGSSRTVESLEALLLKLNPSFQFEDVPRDLAHLYQKPLFKRLKFNEETLTLYHNDLSPEYSIFNTKEEEVYDPSVNHLDRKDLTPDMYELRADENGNLEYFFDPTKARPGFKLIKKPWNELYRGWRTVLVRLLKSGHVKLPDVQRLVGDADRPSWASHTGKNIVSPW